MNTLVLVRRAVVLLLVVSLLTFLSTPFADKASAQRRGQRKETKQKLEQDKRASQDTRKELKTKRGSQDDRSSEQMLPDNLKLDTRRNAAAQELRQLGGKPIHGVPDGWFFTNLKGYALARKYLHEGLIRDCRADIWDPSGEVKTTPYLAASDDYELDVDHGTAKIYIYQNYRTTAKTQGKARLSVRFSIPERRPDGRADPDCPLLDPVEYERAIFRQDALRIDLRGPAGGLFAIMTSNLGTAIELSVSPTKDDALIAYDSCEKGNLWGKTFDHHMLVKVGALFHAHNPVTTRTVGGWKVVNSAEILNPYIVAKVPCKVVASRQPPSPDVHEFHDEFGDRWRR